MRAALSDPRPCLVDRRTNDQMARSRRPPMGPRFGRNPKNGGGMSGSGVASGPGFTA